MALDIEEFGADGVAVIGGPSDVAAREDDALQVHGPSFASLTPDGTTVRDQGQALEELGRSRRGHDQVTYSYSHKENFDKKSVTSAVWNLN